jgi:hypothetical protein
MILFLHESLGIQLVVGLIQLNFLITLNFKPIKVVYEQIRNWFQIEN